MNLVSVPVLGAAAVLTAPALWSALVGTMPAETAVVRYAVVAVLTWVALSALAALVGSPSIPDPDGRTSGTDEVLDPTAVLPAVDDAP